MEPKLNLAFGIRHSTGFLLVAIAIGTAGLAIGCRDRKAPAPMPANAVAMVGDQVITREALQNELTRRTRVTPGQNGDSKERQALLEELIRVEAFHQKALAAGYDRDPQIAASLQRMIVAKYQEDQLARLEQPKVSAEAISNYYGQHPERFGTPEKIRAAMIEFKVARLAPPEKRVEVARHAEAVRAEAVATATTDGTFGALALKYSEDQASRYRGGEMGWLRASDPNAPWDAAVLTAIFQLTQPGAISPVIETPTAFYLVRLSERQPAKMRPFTEVQEGIAYLIAREMQQEQQEELGVRAKQGLLIRINQPLLDTLSVPQKKRGPRRFLAWPPHKPGGSRETLAKT